MKHVLKAAIAAIALAIPAPAQSNEEPPEWYYIDTTESGTVIYARTSDLAQGRSNQTAAKVWVRMNARKDRTVQWRELMSLYIVNCVAQTYRTEQMSAFYPNGKVDTVQRPGETNHITPGTRMEIVTNLLCSDPKRETAAEADYW